MTKRPDPRVPALVPLASASGAEIIPDLQPLTRLPFRVGRDLRTARRSRRRWFGERRRGSQGPNDLYLPESESPHRISRQHFLIGFDPQAGRFFIEDRASQCGTLVGAARIGGGRIGGRRLLQDGDVIRPGGEHSPYAFRFELPRGIAGTNGDGGEPRSSAS